MDAPHDKDAAAPAASSSSQNVGDETVAFDNWPLEADRMAIHSPLVECLRVLAGHYGRRTSENALTAGLPIPATGITPALFERAALRADMNARLIERSLDGLAIAPNMPCILVLDHKQACILWDVSSPEDRAPKKEAGHAAEIDPETLFTVQFPEEPDDRKALTLRQLKTLYSGYTFYVRPVARVDERAGPAVIDTARDWFWGTLKENWSIYREVILATVMINCFALVSTLYIMNVYDRVVPNGAVPSLIALSVGLGLAIQVAVWVAIAVVLYLVGRAVVGP